MPTNLQTILKLNVPLVVRIGEHRLALENVLALGPGAILELDKSAEEDIDLLINNIPVGKGTAMKVGENFGVRITEIGTPQQRVAALGE